MKNSILYFAALGFLFACENKENKGDYYDEEKELTHEQVTRNFRTPENEPGLDYTGSDSLADYATLNQDNLGKLPATLRMKIKDDPKFINKEIARIDSSSNGNVKEYRVTFRGEEKVYRFDSKGNLLND
jgi:hypothetical protein